MSNELMEHPLIKDDRIQLKDKEYRPSGRKYDENALTQMQNDLDEAVKLQETLGLGTVAQEVVQSLKIAAGEMKHVKILDTILRENESFRVVELPGDDLLPRFTIRDSKVMEETGRKTYDNPPLLAMARLNDTNKIRCISHGDKVFEANVPMIPLEGLKKLQTVLAHDPNIETHLAFMPSWEAKTLQRDPILMVKLAGEFVAIHSWGGDKDILDEYIIPKN